MRSNHQQVMKNIPKMKTALPETNAKMLIDTNRMQNFFLIRKFRTDVTQERKSC
jgi:hypothetical protein